jgi:thiol:disulfide interchange protein DsbD
VRGAVRGFIVSPASIPFAAGRRPNYWIGHVIAPLVALLISVLWLAHAGANPVITENATARLVAERQHVAPRETAQLALVLDIRPGWRIYWSNPGDSGEPTRIDWPLPPDVIAGRILWPHPELIQLGPLANYGYSERAIHLIDLRVTVSWDAGRPIDLEASANWLVCHERCIPEEANPSLRIGTGSESTPADRALASIFKMARAGLPHPLQGSRTLRPSGSQLVLEIDSRALPQDPAEVRFFAEEWGLIEHAAEHTWEIGDNRMRLLLTPGPAAAGTPADAAPRRGRRPRNHESR